MLYKEIDGPITDIEPDRYKAICISADFDRDYLDQWHEYRFNGDCLFDGEVIQLVIKEREYQKPTYVGIRESLYFLREICWQEEITKVALPLMGCGKNDNWVMKLNWSHIRGFVYEVFQNTDIDILVALDS